MKTSLALIRETQPKGHEGVKFSVAKMIELINKHRLDPHVVAFARRAVRDAGELGPEKQDPVKIHKAIFDRIKKQGIGWVPDPVRSEFLAGPRHFIPSNDSKDDALMVAGDCDELSMLQACLALCCLAAVGVETSGLFLHAYGGSRAFQHVLGGVYDRAAGSWIRVDHSGDFKFGEYKTPSYEALISLPSGRVACTSERCDRAQPLGVISDEPWDHGRLEGLPRAGGAAEGVFGTLGETAGEEEAVLEAYGQILEGNQWSLVERAESYARARDSMGRTFDRLNLTDEERLALWPIENDQRADELLAAADLARKLLAEVQQGARPWALDDKGNFAIGRITGDREGISSTGNVITLGESEPEPPTLSGAPLAPAVWIALVAGGVVLTLAAFYVIVQALSEITEMAKIAEVKAANEAVRLCLEKGGSPEECKGLAKAVAEVRSSREAEEAKKAQAEAAKAAAQARLAGIVVGVLGVGAAVAGGIWALGGPAAALSKVKGLASGGSAR